MRKITLKNIGKAILGLTYLFFIMFLPALASLLIYHIGMFLGKYGLGPTYQHDTHSFFTGAVVASYIAFLIFPYLTKTKKLELIEKAKEVNE